MKKILSIMIGLCVAVLSVVAQTVPETSQGFNMGSATENNISVVVGQPFGGIFAQNGYQVTEGLSQAQLFRESYNRTTDAVISAQANQFDNNSELSIDPLVAQQLGADMRTVSRGGIPGGTFPRNPESVGVRRDGV